MRNKIIFLLMIFIFSLSLLAQKPEDIGFSIYKVVTTWAGSSVNSYIIVAANNDAIIVDPIDRLSMSNDKILLADVKTGVTKRAIMATEQKYLSYDSKTGLVTDSRTEEQFRYYDLYTMNNETPSKYDAVIDQNKLNVKYIFITHGHLDHFGALNYLKKKTGATVVMNIKDTRGIDGRKVTTEDIENGVLAYPKDTVRIEGLDTSVDMLVNDGDTLTIDNLTFSIMNIPGHSPGSIALYYGKANVPTLFDGDVLLKFDVGRTNFSDGSGSNDDLIDSLERLKKLPDNTIVLPGHGEMTTIGIEKRLNRYF